MLNNCVLLMIENVENLAKMSPSLPGKTLAHDYLLVGSLSKRAMPWEGVAKEADPTLPIPGDLSMSLCVCFFSIGRVHNSL